MKQGLILFAVQLVISIIATVNVRAIAQGNYLWTGITDAIIAALWFTSIWVIVTEGELIYKAIGFTIGAVLGGLSGIYLSKKILKK